MLYRKTLLYFAAIEVRYFILLFFIYTSSLHWWNVGLSLQDQNESTPHVDV